MRLLLDTHVLLWWMDDSADLQPKARNAIADSENLVYLSAVTVWEIVVKRALGKLDIPDNWKDILDNESFRRLPVTCEHALGLEKLPDLHRDPFDRLLLAQAITDDLVLVTHDETMLRYTVRTLRT